MPLGVSVIGRFTIDMWLPSSDITSGNVRLDSHLVAECVPFKVLVLFFTETNIYMFCHIRLVNFILLPCFYSLPFLLNDFIVCEATEDQEKRYIN